MTFGQRLRQLRKERNLKAEELAELANVGESSVFSWEINKCHPSLYAMHQLLDVLDITYEEFMEGVDLECSSSTSCPSLQVS